MGTLAETRRIFNIDRPSLTPAAQDHLPIRPSRRNASPVDVTKGPASKVLPNVVTAASQSVKDISDSRARGRFSTTPRQRDADPDRERQAVAWSLYDEVGELRKAVGVVSDAVASAELYIGKVVPGEAKPERPRTEESDDASDDTPSSITPEGLDEASVEALQNLMLSMVQSGSLRRAAIQLFVSAETYLIGLPYDIEDAAVTPPSTSSMMRLDLPPEGDSGMAMTVTPETVWHALSNSEIRFGDEQKFSGDSNRTTAPLDKSRTMQVMVDGKWHTVDADVPAVNIWNPHPQRSDRLDSAVMASLPILLQLVAVGQYANATMDSRLSGPGILALPKSVLTFSDDQDPSNPEDVQAAMFSFMERLTTAMITPIEDRSSPSAVAPIIVTVDGDDAEKIQRITFDLPLDESINLREEHLIRRLARSLDMPPERLLGIADMNHWGAWAIDEDTLKAHVEPMLEFICRNLTNAIVWPTLEASGMTSKEARGWALGFSTENLQLRPNRMLESQALHDRGVISDETLLREGGFDAADAPQAVDDWASAIETALELVARAPGLGQSPGVRELALAIYSLKVDPPSEGMDADSTSDVLDQLEVDEQESGDDETPDAEVIDTTPTPDSGPGSTEQ